MLFCVLVLKHFDLHSTLGDVSVLEVELKERGEADPREDAQDQQEDDEEDPVAVLEVLNYHKMHHHRQQQMMIKVQ